jgi:membrane-associated phospholipid phosphatase
MRLILTALILATAPQPLAAQHLVPDSTFAARAHRPLVRWYEAAGFAAVAAATFANDRAIRDYVHDRSSKFGNSVADLGNGLGDGLIVYPTLLLGTLGAKAVGATGLSKSSWRALKSSALAGAAALVIKSSIGRQRPFQSPDDPYSFRAFKLKDNALPSGHTAVAFAVATSFAMETKDHWSDAAFFGLAGVTVFARMHYDKHWASDTVVGAGLGILSARFVHRHDRSLVVGPGVVAMSFAF